MVARALECASAGEDTFVDEVLKIACGSGAGGAGDRDVILSAEPSFETLDSFAEDSAESFLLPLIESILDSVVELGFLDQKFAHALGCFLRLQNGFAEIHQPRG